MLPLSHAAFGYLWYAAVAVAVRRRPPTGPALIPLLLASQLPDIIDKPLAFLGVIPSGRSLAHSLLAFVVVTVAVRWACRRYATRVAAPRRRRLLRETPLAVTVGYASHLVGDAYRPLLAGNYADLAFLLFPFVPSPLYPSDDVPPWDRLWQIYTQGRPAELVPLLVVAGLVFIIAIAWRRRRPAG